MNSYEATGVLTLEQLKDILTLKKTFKDKPVAVIECIQSIPCDPCAYVCKFGAVEKKSFGDPPKVDPNKCIGCGECLPKCPGLAIFVVDLKYKENEAKIMIPYELLPIPKKGEIYQALDRQGEVVGEARILATKIGKNRTAIVTISVKKPLAMTVRNIGKRLK